MLAKGEEGIKTLDDLDFSEKKTLVRVDINTPIDPKTGELIGEGRFLSHKKTLEELIEKKAKVVVMAHQGRPGDADFTTFEKHAEKLSQVLNHPVKYIPAIFGKYAQEEIKKLNPGEVLLLENVRFYSEENIKAPGEVQAKTHMVRKLSPVLDVYVNDAFATAHRSQPSMVGFPQVLPSCAGRLLEKELKIIGGIMENPQKPLTFVLGGTKADDAFKAAQKALEKGTADYILTGGLVGNILLVAKGHQIGDVSMELIKGKNMVEQIDVAKNLLGRYEDKVIIPIDVALEQDGKRVEIEIGELPKNYPIKDVGKGTVKKYSEIITKSKTIFAKGALGVFEEKNFAYGTEEVVKKIAESDAHSVLGGGHLVASARKLQIEDKITHISSGGGACISFLAGEKLPAVEALRGK